MSSQIILLNSSSTFGDVKGAVVLVAASAPPSSFGFMVVEWKFLHGAAEMMGCCCFLLTLSNNVVDTIGRRAPELIICFRDVHDDDAGLFIWPRRDRRHAFMARRSNLWDMILLLLLLFLAEYYCC